MDNIQKAENQEADQNLKSKSLGASKQSSIIFLYLASIAYLVIEVVFNFSLLNAISANDISADDIHDVESFGRVASSIGFTLFAIGFFYKDGFFVNKASGYQGFIAIIVVSLLPYISTPVIQESIIAVVCIAVGAVLVLRIGINKSNDSGLIYSLLSIASFALITFPAFYYGKPAIVNNFIVEPSSGEERLLSKYATAVKNPLIDGTIQLDDISIESFGGAKQPEAKAFLAMIGPIISSSQQIRDWFENPKNKRKVAEKIIEKHPEYQLDDHWQKYQQKGKDFKEINYRDYKKLSTQFKNAKSMAQEQWIDVEIEKDVAWDQYKNAQRSFIDSVIRSVSPLQMKNLEKLDKRCKGRYDLRTRRGRWCFETLNKNIGTRNRDDLCPKDSLIEKFDESLGTNYQVKNSAQRIATNLSYALSPIGWLSYLADGNDTRTCWKASKSYGFAMATNVKHEEFERLSSNKHGLDLFIFSEADFIDDERFLKGLREQVNNNFKKEGLNLLLDEDWDMGQHKVFVQNTTELIKKQTNIILHNTFGQGMQYALSYDRFEQDFRVQNLIKEQLGDEYIESFSFEWTKEQFYKKYFLRVVEKQIDKKKAEFEIQARKYDNGSEFEEEGKEYKRYIIVPPIAIALSLFFSFTSLAKVVQLTLTLIKMPKLWPTLSFYLVLLIVPILFFTTSNQYLETKAWSALKTEGKNYHPATIFGAEFVIKIEPYLYKYGRFITEIYDPFPGVNQVNGEAHYEGKYKNGEFHGQGVFTTADGSRYEGEFKNGKFHGQGALTTVDGSRYEGGWKNSKKNGQGTYIWVDGSRYDGEFKNNKFHGQGVKTETDGSRYEGGWKNDKPHGQGVLTLLDGFRYEGKHKNGEFHGQGVLTTADGSRYEGEFKNGILHGP